MNLKSVDKHLTVFSVSLSVQYIQFSIPDELPGPSSTGSTTVLEKLMKLRSQNRLGPADENERTLLKLKIEIALRFN